MKKLLFYSHDTYGLGNIRRTCPFAGSLWPRFPICRGASIAENIAYGKPDATADEIEAAAKQAHIHEWIVTLPDGYDTVIGEQGCTMSGGQRQRICLARAFIKRPSILILDEPTSAVDPVSASLIHRAIAQSQQGKTILFIAHQLTAMHQFDQILVLHHGRIVEHGPHRELLNLKGHYYELYRMHIA
ncbi:MAG: ATP-binding cassette domain-containing protein [Nitrospirae bacterium]|nr:MAG: ATP-binding cassette domain-containing protein [Nitrospirota bacterium]